MTYLLDTSVAIELRERNRDLAIRLAATQRVPSIAMLTLVELEGGVRGDDGARARRRAAVDELIGSMHIIDLDREIVDVYAGIIAAVGFSRRRVIDRLIAATAIVHDMTLITINAPDFRDIPALKLEIWPSPAQ